MSGEENKPYLLINFRRNRITIRKKTLQMIGDPEYILLLVNPQQRTLVILKSDETERRAQRICQLTNRRGFELTSKGLLRTLLNLCGHLQNICSYRLEGEAVLGENAVKFNIDDSKQIS